MASVLSSILVFCFFFTSALAESLQSYLNKNISQVCSHSTDKMNLLQLKALLESSHFSGSCKKYEITYIKSLNTQPQWKLNDNFEDKYTGPLLVIKIIEDQGVNSPLFNSAVIQLREGLLCVQERDSTKTLAYNLNITNDKRLTRYQHQQKLILQFQKKNLVWLGLWFSNLSESALSKKNLNQHIFQCGL